MQEEGSIRRSHTYTSTRWDQKRTVKISGERIICEVVLNKCKILRAKLSADILLALSLSDHSVLLLYFPPKLIHLQHLPGFFSFQKSKIYLLASLLYFWNFWQKTSAGPTPTREGISEQKLIESNWLRNRSPSRRSSKNLWLRLEKNRWRNARKHLRESRTTCTVLVNRNFKFNIFFFIFLP